VVSPASGDRIALDGYVGMFKASFGRREIPVREFKASLRFAWPNLLSFVLVGDLEGGLGGGVVVSPCSGPRKVDVAKAMFKASFGRVIEVRDCLPAGYLTYSSTWIDRSSLVLSCA
jgi:hypothetical protein